MDYTTMPDDVIACVMTHYKTGLNKRGMERARAKAHKDITMRQLLSIGFTLLSAVNRLHIAFGRER